MLVYVFIYAAVLMIFGFVDYFKIKEYEDFAVAGKKQSTIFVVMSFMATMIGASATVGIVGRTASVGFPAFWWLAVGSVGLILQSLFLSKMIRDMDVNTLPSMVNVLTGRVGQLIVALIITISWPAVIASQINAMATVLGVFTDKADDKLLLAIIAIVVIIYTTFGGQLSVVKTDAIQFVIITISFAVAFVYIFAFGNGDNSVVLNRVEFFNDSFKVKDLIVLLFTVGGTYLLGPDVVSRNLLAKDGSTAKKSSFRAAILLLFFSVVIVFMGLWVIENANNESGANPLVFMMTDVVPKPVGVFLGIGILSTILSSLDTCLVNVAAIIETDILKRNKILETRIIAIVVGAVSIAMAFSSGDIISKLTGAYSIYAPGVVFPLLVALLAYKKRKICIPVWVLGVIAGGACGFYSTYIDKTLTDLPLIGMFVSLAISLVALAISDKN